jgi:hypothetical protein
MHEIFKQQVIEISELVTHFPTNAREIAAKQLLDRLIHEWSQGFYDPTTKAFKPSGQ